MVTQNRKDCNMKKLNPLELDICSITCSGLVLTKDNVYKCPFNGDKLSQHGLDNINKLTATERFWSISN